MPRAVPIVTQNALELCRNKFRDPQMWHLLVAEDHCRAG